jgi:hypothetical protein
MLLSPAVVTWICLATAKKMNIIKAGRYEKLFFLLLSCLFYVSFFFGQYTIPKLNDFLHGVNARIMGIEGFLQDLLVPVVVLIPAYYLLNYVFKVHARSKFLGFLFLIVYYALNSIVWSVYLAMVTHKIY